ncbi:MAG: FAD-dependent monooxygenase [Gammaproteobacteria bacterium]|nr:FAD-dependent monooxygenase [Gammaproteobacteria bacterium]
MKGILISGAGIAGLSIARQLKKHGVAYTLIEKKPNLDMAGISIALPANAVRALRYMGFSEAVEKMHQVNRIIYSRSNGTIISQASLLDAPLSLDKFVALDRSNLLAILRQDVEADITFNVTITQIKQHNAGVDVKFSNPALNGQYHAVIGADGIHSTVRELGFEKSGLVDLGVTNWRWMCDYPTEHIQPNYMLGMKNAFLAYPAGPDRIYCYAQQSDAKGQFQNTDKACENLSRLFAKYKGVAAPLLKRLPENKDIYTGRLRSVPSPLFHQGNLALIGDASNACSPMLQQGAATAFEDAIILSELLVNFPVPKAFEHYHALRHQRVEWITKTSDDAIKAFIKINSRLAMIARNVFIKYKGPLNVLGWKQILSNCPLDNMSNFIQNSSHKIKEQLI